jgi:hypothetical protein
MGRSFRGQLVLGLIALAVLLTTTVLTAVAGFWPGVVIQAVFVLTWAARVVVLFRMKQRGAYATAPPPGVLLNLEYLLVLRVQLVAWIVAGIYFAIVSFWWGVVVAAFLAYLTVPLMGLIHRKVREYGSGRR